MRDAVKEQATSSPSATADARTSLVHRRRHGEGHVAYVSGNMFPVFGLEPTFGRLLAPADDRGPGAGPYAVPLLGYWNHRFGRDPHVLGRSLHIGDQTFEIIGVGPRDYWNRKGTVTDVFLPSA